MKLIFYVFFFSLVISPKTSYSKSIELKKNGKSIFVEDKKNWKLGKDLFGMPFILFSPRDNGQRSNISFTDTGARLELDFKELQKNQDSFKSHKKEWASTVGAEIKSFSSYKTSLNKYGHRIHQIGLNYLFKEKSYQESSYYIECRGKIIFSKSLRLTESSQHEKDFNDYIQNLDCGGV
jgi:hypothetical protein